MNIVDANIYYVLFCLSLQIIAIILVYFLYLCNKNIIVKSTISWFVILLSYTGLFCTILLKPQLLNPFIGIFNTDSLIEKRLDIELSNTPNHILISLSKDLTGQNSIKYQYDSAEMISTAKAIIKENQHKLLEQNNIKYLQNIDYLDIRNAARYDSFMSAILKSTSIIYGIILLLCIFSLQKTARKNSIIPS